MRKKTFNSISFGLFIFFMTLHPTEAQEYFSLNVDNDLYFNTDHYYSSGIFLQYGKQPQSSDDSNRYVLWELGQEIYTPNNRYKSNSNEFDYPYGGWTSIKLSFQKGISQKKQSQWGIQMGVTGTASGAQWMQNTYHRLALGLRELTWVDEVPQAFHINVFADSFKRWELMNKVVLQSHVFATVGTQKIVGGAALGFVLNNQTAPARGGNILLDQRQGYGFYLGGRLQIVAHDYMLSGSLFNDKAPFTLPSKPFRTTLEAGYALRKNQWRIAYAYYNRSPDNTVQPQKGHHYLNITLSRFFDRLTPNKS